MRASAETTARLSNSPPRLPRARDAAITFRRDAWLARSVSTGWPVVLTSSMTNLPGLPALAAASAAVLISASLSPASSARVSNVTAIAPRSFSTFCANVVCSVASSAFSARSLALLASGSCAPARTKSWW